MTLSFGVIINTLRDQAMLTQVRVPVETTASITRESHPGRKRQNLQEVWEIYRKVASEVDNFWAPRSKGRGGVSPQLLR